ncbi:SMP-30/gluconolactonase/LRE family protein [Rouxiella badensis]|jgi:gluconolactonase|uniref:Gluconolactonase n=1 Tax=Rouxiella badensis TaxID=1646377 RepID=A0A1X0WAS2_9GAMM|nr:SMP-30/gluconolactonase/LRE family protein [Rouxiella badensis]MCC3719716.1 SMP-30/gluconolactonase/LRE family protein [Rouxiella badensis]MCC3728966.1 SMP-30/gluconolactonase/LRE family protein [Rouxiella badensis]MCC3733393.1 SMP-30/gluconolactonase/LRE family protein [Rouxiella badensis]MCC3740838.1 SMP-30/gluconolactonase/LRE family protein [Rouxiella badensis]MCC3757956.1 SMP-30/gluconolactonase/LRE family protein [Rouxiella badensis]
MSELNWRENKLEKLCSPAIWAEGPVWLPYQQAIVFSDVKGNRMFRWSAEDGVSLFRASSNFANGNALDADGRIVSCEHGRRGISRTDAQGEVTLLVDRVDGKRFNSPNDVVVRSDGTIWFTDPPYGIINDEEGFKSESQVIGCYVYCFNPRTHALSIATSDVQRPNGLAFSPDESLLYVADMSIVDFPTLGRRELRVFPVEENRLGIGRFFAEVAPGIPDGFCIDEQGRIFCSCEDGVIIFNADGQRMGKIPVPERVSNCTFGGENGDELYITATTSLYRLRLGQQ